MRQIELIRKINKEETSWYMNVTLDTLIACHGVTSITVNKENKITKAWKDYKGKVRVNKAMKEAVKLKFFCIEYQNDETARIRLELDKERLSNNN